ncbi:RAD55 family ATPase [Pigmentiphaga litoralis]|uniref:RAD55 family ATPase n=1 Tax=Pigmentiphaga litoralis TaxID=516702 RepID=UPI003B42DB68
MVNRLKRLKSTVPGLDDILCGGFVEGASYILRGRPGAGKTILANQIAFAQARDGNSVMYVTLLAESHERLFEALSTLDFYDAQYVGSNMTYVSLFQTLRSEGLDAVVTMLRKEMARRNPTMLVVDGLLTARDAADDSLDVKTFVAELQANAAFSRCTILLLTSAQPGDASPEHTMVDGVVELHEDFAGARTSRRLQVTKSRGSGALSGLHHYEITQAGMAVFPRLEALLSRPSMLDAAPPDRLASGVDGLDDLIGGGIPAASVTLAMGPSGTGKTTLGLSFLKFATPERPAVMLSFAESPQRLFRKATAIGIDLESMVATKAVTLIWCPLTESLVDRIAYELLDAVAAVNASRIVIDGYSALERTMIDKTRVVEFFSALGNELKGRGATVVATWETRNLFGLRAESPTPEISGIVDNLFLLKQHPAGADLRRVLGILKIRDGFYPASMYEIAVGHGGLQMCGKFDVTNPPPDEPRAPVPQVQ